MKYNLSIKSIFTLFNAYDQKYVSLAIRALEKENKAIPILQKKYGPKYDGVGGSAMLSYADEEYLDRLLMRIESYIQAIKVLSEVYKESNSQILNKFYRQTDMQTIAMVNKLTSGNKPASKSLLPSKFAILTEFKTNENVLARALEHIENPEHRMIYIYRYGIERNKMDFDSILEMFPKYSKTSIMGVLLKVQSELPKYIDMERNVAPSNDNYVSKTKVKATIGSPKVVAKPSTPHETVNQSTSQVITKSRTSQKTVKQSSSKVRKDGTGFRFNSLFDYFYTESDTPESIKEKKGIILDYLEYAKVEKVELVKYIFGESYDQLQPNVELTQKQQNQFKELRKQLKKYIDRILLLRKGKKDAALVTDRVFLPNDNCFKECLNDYFPKNRNYSSTLHIFDSYLSTHEDVRNIVGKYYDLETKKLKNNTYTSKEDANNFKGIIKDAKSYIAESNSNFKGFKKRFVDYFKKRNMTESRILTLYEYISLYIDTLNEDEKKLLQKIYSCDYKKINTDIDITTSDKELFNKILEKVGKYVDHVLEMLNTYNTNIFRYFHNKNMTYAYKEKLDDEIRQYLNKSSSEGKKVAVMLYGTSYDKLNAAITLSSEQVDLFNSLIREIDCYIETIEYKLKGRKQPSIDKPFIENFVDPNATEEQNEITKKAAKEIIDNDQSIYKILVIKFFGENYDKKYDLEFSKQDEADLKYFREKILKKMIGNGPFESIYDVVFNGKRRKKRKADVIKETNRYLVRVEPDIKKILIKVYGEDYNTYNSNAKLTIYELYILNNFYKDLKQYIAKKVTSYQKLGKFEGYVKTKNGSIPGEFLYFAEDLLKEITKKDELSEEEIEKFREELKEFIHKSKSKYAGAIIKLYGEDIGTLDETIDPTAEEIDAVHHMSRNIKSTYNTKQVTKKNSNFYGEIGKKFKLSERIFDNFINYPHDSNEILIINRINYNINLHKKSLISNAFHQTYGEDLTEYHEIEFDLSKTQLTSFKASLKRLNDLLNEELIDYSLKSDLLEYFYNDLSNRENLVKEFRYIIDNFYDSNGIRFRNVVNYIYDSNFKLVRPMLLRSEEVSSFKEVINKVTSSKNQQKKEYMTCFFDYFLFEGEKEVPKERIQLIKKMLRKNKSTFIEDVKELYGPEFDQECTDYARIDELRQGINYIVKNITNRLTKNFSKGIRLLADNFIEQFYREDDTPEMKNLIRDHVSIYVGQSNSIWANVVKNIYDENYNIRENYQYDFDKGAYFNFIKSVSSSVQKFRDRYEKNPLEESLLIEAKKKALGLNMEESSNHTSDITSSSDDSLLALTNDLFDIKLIGDDTSDALNFEITDDIILNAYNELNDSSSIMDLLMISSDTLVNFYLNHIDDLDDPYEAFNYLVHLGEKDIIKKLMTSPFFARVLNYLSDKERDVIYLKLVQISKSSLTDEKIAQVTKLDINIIREYEIMTNNDKVNSLNVFIKKRK